MGIKRRAGKAGPAKSEDKKARFEAGMDFLQGNHWCNYYSEQVIKSKLIFKGDMNLDETVLEQIVKEVRAPKTVQSNIYQFVSEISGLLEKCELTKISTSKLKNFPITPNEHIKFPGAKILQCSPINALKSKNLGKLKRRFLNLEDCK